MGRSGNEGCERERGREQWVVGCGCSGMCGEGDGQVKEPGKSRWMVPATARLAPPARRAVALVPHRLTCDMWHVARDMWHVTCGMWHVTCDM